jgi:hypothetical protein
MSGFSAAGAVKIYKSACRMCHGGWFPEDETPEHGVWQSNANMLTSSEPPYDPAVGTYQLRALLCRVYKAQAPG